MDSVPSEQTQLRGWLALSPHSKTVQGLNLYWGVWKDPPIQDIWVKIRGKSGITQAKKENKFDRSTNMTVRIKDSAAEPKPGQTNNICQTMQMFCLQIKGFTSEMMCFVCRLKVVLLKWFLYFIVVYFDSEHFRTFEHKPITNLAVF